jgi:hypothetical protein
MFSVCRVKRGCRGGGVKCCTYTPVLYVLRRERNFHLMSLFVLISLHVKYTNKFLGSDQAGVHTQESRREPRSQSIFWVRRTTIVTEVLRTLKHIADLDVCAT